MTEDHRTKPLPETSKLPGSREATPDENPTQPRNRFRQALQKCKKNVIKKVSKPFKRSRHQTPTVQNADHKGGSSNQNVEDVSRLHPSDDNKAITSENPSGCVNQGASRKPTPKALVTPPSVEEIPDPQLVNAGLRDAHEGVENMRPLGKHATSVASAANDGPKDLNAADNFQSTYLQPLKIFDTVVENLANVWATFLDWKRPNQVA
ncbi:hypothetical protein BDR07DRAFT_418979 [Suillus spraguei]|nr:hypothetical protein BDR07DRAFT_418979 [Suillus spraguei]